MMYEGNATKIDVLPGILPEALAPESSFGLFCGSPFGVAAAAEVDAAS